MSIASSIERVTQLLRRRRRARELGFTFRRTKAFALPSGLTIAGRHVRLDVPAERGARNAFLDVLLDDCYGLRRFEPNSLETILDIGGHVGFFALAARQAFPRATIQSYEPNPVALSSLVQHALEANFQVFAEAVGA